MLFSSHVQLFHMYISQSYFLMQGALPNQMGVRYSHIFLILLLLHGANAALKDPVQKWRTLSGNMLAPCISKTKLFD